ncbi:MAG: HAD family phosphatase [Phycisphaerae bacterium]|nr:HAD family phosphatase [Phycisphaerae bacterium]
MTGYAAIFDIDGVLVDSYRAHLESWQRLGAEASRPISESMFAATFGRTSREIIREWWGVDIDDERVEAMDRRKELFYRQIISVDFPVMDGAVELIDALHEAGWAIGAGSSGPAANVELALEKLGRRHLFAAAVTGDDVTRGKPDPQVFQIVAERLAADSTVCVVIEDAPAGVAAAKAAGMACIGLTGTAPHEDLAAADLVIRSLKELSVSAAREVVDSRRRAFDPPTPLS